MINWLKSRKGKLTIGSLLTITASVLTGGITLQVGITLAVQAIAANVLGIAIEDAGAKSSGILK
jgi:hypothetical protein